MKNIIRTIFLLAIGIISLYGCKKEIDKDLIELPYLTNGSLYEFLKKDPELTQFMGLVKKAGYDSVLRRIDMYTVLAVKNGGFTGIDTNNLLNVKKVVGNHIVPSAIYKERMDQLRLPTVSGKYVKFMNALGIITANGVVVGDSTNRAQIGERQKSRFRIQIGKGSLGHCREAVGADVMRNLEAFSRQAVKEVAGNRFAGRVADAVNEPVEGRPML